MLFDAVIPVHKNDIRTLEHCIKGIKCNAINLRNVYYISDYEYSQNAIWCNQQLFPFKFKEIKALTYGKASIWVYQQLLKLYAPLIIPNILPNILILDCDTIFFKKVNFFEKSIPLYNLGKDLNLFKSEFYCQTTEHIKKLIPQIEKKYPEIFFNSSKDYDLLCDRFLKKLNYLSYSHKNRAKYLKSGVCNHMIFQRNIIEHLFEVVKRNDRSNDEFYKIFLRKFLNLNFVSEYNLYFYFLITYYPQSYKIRMLKYNSTSVFKPHIDMMRFKYDYCSYHSHLANDSIISRIVNKITLN
ncbi:MAG: hypothetical protein CMP18_02925 [Rickettsiales bacterium]|jgi:hypothetical protein|nr:hypothetical protein [Rickettsiales bacterium]|tara:strand:- start:7907 stop:8800 length:894 start_codon:yes stop_codon:yes gene_type:complete